MCWRGNDWLCKFHFFFMSLLFGILAMPTDVWTLGSYFSIRLCGLPSVDENMRRCDDHRFCLCMYCHMFSFFTFGIGRMLMKIWTLGPSLLFRIFRLCSFCLYSCRSGNNWLRRFYCWFALCIFVICVMLIDIWSVGRCSSFCFYCAPSVNEDMGQCDNHYYTYIGLISFLRFSVSESVICVLTFEL